MIGDRLIFQDIHYRKAKTILPKVIAAFYHNRFVLCIGGGSGTGKTELASLLQQDLWEQHKLRAKVVHLDDYYKTLWLERNKIRKQKGMKSVGLKEIDWKKVKKVVSVFKSKNKYLYTQKIHKYTNSIEESKSDNRCIDILIIDGLYANYLKEKSYGVYLEGSIKDTDKFRKVRGKEIQNAFRYKVLRKELRDGQLTKKYADLIIPFKVK